MSALTDGSLVCSVQNCTCEMSRETSLGQDDAREEKLEPAMAKHDCQVGLMCGQRRNVEYE